MLDISQWQKLHTTPRYNQVWWLCDATETNKKLDILLWQDKDDEDKKKGEDDDEKEDSNVKTIVPAVETSKFQKYS